MKENYKGFSISFNENSETPVNVSIVKLSNPVENESVNESRYGSYQNSEERKDYLMDDIKNWFDAWKEERIEMKKEELKKLAIEAVEHGMLDEAKVVLKKLNEDEEGINLEEEPIEYEEASDDDFDPKSPEALYETIVNGNWSDIYDLTKEELASLIYYVLFIIDDKNLAIKISRKVSNN